MCQTVWIQIRSDVLSGMIWVQTVCKGYQQTTLVDKKLNLLCELHNPMYNSNNICYNDLPAQISLIKVSFVCLNQEIYCRSAVA